VVEQSGFKTLGRGGKVKKRLVVEVGASGGRVQNAWLQRWGRRRLAVEVGAGGTVVA